VTEANSCDRERAQRKQAGEREGTGGLGSGASEWRGRDGNVCFGFLPLFFRCGMEEEKMMGWGLPLARRSV
jgi:hypothetical protein